MEKIVVYFHGYNSSAQTDKVQKLKDAGFSTYSWDINLDASISLNELTDKIDSMLLDNMHSECELFFVGTSLGAWYAANLAQLYDVHAVLINPCYNPKQSLAKYNVDQTILDSYLTDIQFTSKHKVFIGTNDTAIDFSNVDFGNADVVYVKDADHRFNKEFHLVVDYIREFK